MDGKEAKAHNLLNQTEEENELLADVYHRCKQCAFMFTAKPPHKGSWCYMFEKVQIECMKFLPKERWV